jgi:sugar O-acyltransferase (sialic acid O-acetyltransferase NeuD family)
MTSLERVVVVGASGFGRECLDVLEAMAGAGSSVEVAGVVDDGPTELNLERLAARGVAYLGTIEEWLATDAEPLTYVLGVGSPDVRRRLVVRLEDAGAQPFTAVHPSAIFGSRVLVGEGVVVCAGATVSTNVRLGRHVHVNPNATIGHDAVLEEFVSVNPGAVVSGGVVAGESTVVGASATILQNLNLGHHVTIGAGAVVTRGVPDSVVVTGVPGSWRPPSSERLRALHQGMREQVVRDDLR